MKKVLITGASGMVGGIVLREALDSEEVSKVVSLVRKPSGLHHEKLIEKVHGDFADFSGTEESFSGIDAAYFCIGVYTGSVPDDVFKTITVDFAQAFADALKEQSPSAKLAFLSGQGADEKEKSRISFARYKGMAENHLLRSGLGGLSIFRPAYIYPVTPREEPSFMYSLSRKLYPYIGRWIPSVTSKQLGQAMFNAGLHGTDQPILENKDILDLYEAFV